MENTIGIVMRSLVLSLVSGISAQIFFETVVPRRKLRYGWLDHTTILAFMIGYMIIAVTEIPPYYLQPVRLIAVIVIVAYLYFQMSFVRNLMLSVVYCGVYWIFSVLFFSLVSLTPITGSVAAVNMMEPLLEVIYLCLMFGFRYQYRRREGGWTEIRWEKLGLVSLTGIVVCVALVMMSPTDNENDAYARMITLAGFAVVYVLGFYYMVNMLEKESQMQRLRMLYERTRNQMELYRGMKKRYEQQRRYQHDYKNQLNCISGMIGEGQTQEALTYIAKLTGSFRQSEMSVNTNHSVVNVVLNQKYQEACDRGIAMAVIANDLSGLSMSEEDIVTLLGNLLDNAIEACEKLEQNRIIQFKMILEDEQLVLSIRNPIEEPLRIRNNRIASSKKDKSRHGIGLLNVDSVIRKNGGTGVLQCQEGWFCFSAMIPMEA